MILIRNIHSKDERKKLFTRLDGRGVSCLFKHNKSDRIVAQEAEAFQSSDVGAYAEKEDGPRNAKPGRRNLSLYLLSIWQAEHTFISSKQGLESNRKASAYSY